MDRESCEIIINHVNGKIDDLKIEIKELKNDIKELNAFKWKAFGVAMSLLFFVESWRILVEIKH